jgi:hypothetical protein
MDKALNSKVTTHLQHYALYWGVSYIEKLEPKSIWTKEVAAVDDCVFDRKAHCWKFVKIISYLLELLDKWLHKTYTPHNTWHSPLSTLHLYLCQLRKAVAKSLLMPTHESTPAVITFVQYK